MTELRRIDAHHHVWDLEVRDQPWTAGLPTLRRSFGLAELQPALPAQRVDATVVVQTVCVPDETPELLSMAHENPVVAGVVGWTDLTSGQVGRELDRLARLPGGDRLVGVRHQVQDETDPAWLCRPDVRAGLQAVAASGLAYDVVVRPGQLAAVIDTVRALPGLRFVLDHCGKPPGGRGVSREWASDLARLAQLPNVAVKLSGLATELDPPHWDVSVLQPFVDVVLEAFGAAGVMFGSDWPVCLLAGDYAEAVEAADALCAALSPSERAEIFAGTARRWYGLSA